MTCQHIGLALDVAKERLGRLGMNERVVLQFLAILKEYVNRTNLLQFLNATGVLDDDQKRLNMQELTSMLGRMAKLKLVVVVTRNQGTNYFACNSGNVAFCAIRDAIDSGHFKRMVKVVRGEKTLAADRATEEQEKLLRRARDLKLAVFAHDEAGTAGAWQHFQDEFPNLLTVHTPWAEICPYPLDASWFRLLPPSIQASAMEGVVLHRLEWFESVADILPLLEELRQRSDSPFSPRFRRLLAVVLTFQGRLAEAQAILDAGRKNGDDQSVQGWIHFLRGENATAIQVFSFQLKTARKMVDKRKLALEDMSGLFFFLALLKEGLFSQIEELLELEGKKPFGPVRPYCACLRAFLLARENQKEEALALIKKDVQWFKNDSMAKTPDASLTSLLKTTVRFWIDANLDARGCKCLPALFEQARTHGHQWPAMEAAGLMVLVGDKNQAAAAEYVDAVQKKTGMQSMLNVVVRMEEWQQALTALIQMGEGNAAQARKGSRRLVWLISVGDDVVQSIEPKVQSLSAAGTWSVGRAVALRRLYDCDDGMDFLTEQDLRISEAIVREYSYHGCSYGIVWPKAMLAMVGHPLVFWEDDPSVSIEVVKVEPELLVEQKDGRLLVRFAEPVEQEGLMAIRESPVRCKLVEIAPAHRRIAEILGISGLQVPVQAKEQVMEAMQAVAPMVTIHSGIGGSMANIEEVPSDSMPRVHLLPQGQGLKVSMLVRPFSGEGPCFQPGRGGRTIIAEVNGRRIQTHRRLEEETERAGEVVAACPSLSAVEGLHEWTLEDPEACLELLLELQSLTDQLVVAWPEGETMRVGRQVDMDNMRVRIQQDHDWFSMSGELALDDGKVMEMNSLLDLIRTRKSRFVPLGEGRFLALTETFRKRMEELDAFSEKRASGRRFHPLAGPAFRELLDGGCMVEADKHWQDHVRKMDNALLLKPEPPSTLQADLHEYQLDGFRWLAQLAAWGVGACLADDMGLGKTLQTLTLLLHRAKEGPSLVVAPTSVALNWQSEIARFAPTLNGIMFGGSLRQKTLDELKPFDVLICSYGLLQQESQMLAAVAWNVVVLDEAQAIKVRMSKRSLAAMALKGACKIITTGTPVENHLGELWTLFRFLNPGLLGSLAAFNEQFAVPIERHKDKNAQKRLRKLLQPFLLRRTKSQVLEELPSRTEIVLNVEPSLEEQAFYETLRRRALEQIEGIDVPVEEKRFQILAEIMRLRRACCNSRLVLPDSPIESSKLALFWEVVAELLENRHKVLVFSQFVDHLAIIRSLLDQKGIAYQYLDGSTPAKERKARIDAFQAGKGDLFLISLKAGGMGINLTAADYVIHMDPWWNPAVEDQASDRAHRIGQQRPVTIYRLVVRNTIEEKILALHRHKRDLAEGLLEGGDMSGKLSVEELLNMIREGGHASELSS